MRGRNKIIKLVLFFSITMLIYSCKDETVTKKEPENIGVAEFVFIPEHPTMKSETSMVFYGCSYYQTTSIVIVDNKIEVRKHFNSQLKWPCILVNDTINLGKLKKGDYNVTLEIIDINPYVTDTVFYSETKPLTISNK